MRRFLLALIIGLSVAFRASAQDVDLGKLDDLTAAQETQKKVEQEISTKRTKVQSDIKSLKRDLIKLSADIKALETENTALEGQLTQLGLDREFLESDILQNRAKMSEFLAALQRIEDNPPPAIAANPNDAADAARAAMLASSISAQLDKRVDALSIKLAALDELLVDISRKQTILSANRAKIEIKREKVEQSVLDKNTLERGLSKDFDKAKLRSVELAKEAETLRDLIASLERDSHDIAPRLKPKPGDPDPDDPAAAKRYKPEPLDLGSGNMRFAEARGRVISPISGTLSIQYSSDHPGLSVSASSQSQVVAPIKGRIEFAGPFKNYEKVVILNVGDGYFVLLTGLGELYVQNGAYIDAGEPVGLMPVNSRSATKLYIEVRKNGSTVDPTPWFGTSFAKHRTG